MFCCGCFSYSTMNNVWSPAFVKRMDSNTFESTFLVWILPQLLFSSLMKVPCCWLASAGPVGVGRDASHLQGDHTGCQQ